MLDHFDSLLQAPHSADMEEVRVVTSMLVQGQCAPELCPSDVRHVPRRVILLESAAASADKSRCCAACRRGR